MGISVSALGSAALAREASLKENTEIAQKRSVLADSSPPLSGHS